MFCEKRDKMMLILILLITQVSSERTSYQSSVFVSRKSRSNGPPLESGYLFEQVNDKPGVLASYTLDTPPRLKINAPARLKMDAPKSLGIKKKPPNLVAASSTKNVRTVKVKIDPMYEKMKPFMFYHPSASEMMNNYAPMHNYNADDDDLRTASRSSSDYHWPLITRPYEQDNVKMDTKQAPVEDRSNPKTSSSDFRPIIPVHEYMDEQQYAKMYYATPHRYTETTTPYVYPYKTYSSDYFGKSKMDDDPLEFKMDWTGNDHKPAPTVYHNVIEAPRNVRRIDQYPANNAYANARNHDSYNHKAGDAVNEKGYEKRDEYDKHDKGNNANEKHNQAYEHGGKVFNGYKDFIDSFAKKYALDDNKKDSNFYLKRHQDKADNKKGFHRVYHKDEYQMDNEFFDNTGLTAGGVEKGSTTAHKGGSEGFIKSHGHAALGEEGSAFNKAGEGNANAYENNHKGHDAAKGYDGSFNRYKVEARDTALSNDNGYNRHV